MADPVSAMAAVGVGSKIGGAIMGASGAAFSGKAQRNMYGYQSGMALVNKSIAEGNADYTRKVGEINAGESGLKSRFQMGKITAAQGASGLDVNRGSAPDVRAGQQMIAQTDQSIIRASAARRAYAYDNEALKYGSESDLDIMSAKVTGKATKLNIASSLLGGASSVADKWTQGKSVGLFGSPSSGSDYSGLENMPEDI